MQSNYGGYSSLEGFGLPLSSQHTLLPAYDTTSFGMTGASSSPMSYGGDYGADWGGGYKAPQGGGFGDFFKGMIGTKDTPGWGGTVAGAAQGLFAGYMGMQQYGLAKEKLAESKKQFELNYNAQKGLTNSNLEDRQRARVASNAGGYQSVGEYMDKYGVK